MWPRVVPLRAPRPRRRATAVRQAATLLLVVLAAAPLAAADGEWVAEGNAAWQAREPAIPSTEFLDNHARGMGRELFAGDRRLVRSAEEGAVTWI